MNAQRTAHQETWAKSTTGFAHPQKNVNALDIRPGDRVADFGAGSGAYVYELASLVGEKGAVYAIDVQRDLLDRIKNEAHRRHLAHIHVIWSDLERHKATKLKDASLDVVLISNLLFQIESKKAVLAEARRVLKKSGRLAIIDWSASFGGLGPIKKHVVTKEQALQLAADAGFMLEREFAAGAHHYGLTLMHAPVAQ